MRKWTLFALSVLMCFGLTLKITAASPANVTAAIDNSTGIVTVSGSSGLAGEHIITVQVRDPHNRLAFLDQGESDANGDYLFSFTLNKRVLGTYSVSVGGESADSVSKTAFLVSPPELKADISPQQPDGQNDWYIHPVSITISALGGLPDGYSIQYHVNQGDWTAYDSAFRVDTNGTNTIEYRYMDEAGNPGPVKSTVLKIDTAAPVTTATASPVDGSNGWYVSDPTVTLSATDQVSVTQTVYRVNSGSWSPYTQSVTLSGTSHFEYKSIDQAGNEEAVQSLTLQVDKEPPTIGVTLDKNTLWPANNKLVTVTAAVYASDTISQIDNIVLTSITSSEPSEPGDIQDAQYGTFDTSFALRAQRAGSGSGRIYTVTYTATDKAGNRTTGSATVEVPHDQSGKDKK